MLITSPEAAFADDRGSITDLVAGPIDHVTRVTTKAGAVRGNHFHERTEQWAFVVSGCLQVSDGVSEAILRSGEAVYNPPGEPHAWHALEDTECIVVVKGPRAGAGYESDTTRLEEPILR